ncbi:hypothetical protein ES703_107010 [subsurface metagenome]
MTNVGALERNIRPLQVTAQKRPVENRCITHFQTHITHLGIITTIRNLACPLVNRGRISDNHTRCIKRNLRQVKFTACQGDIISGKFILRNLLKLRRPNINRYPAGRIEIPHHRAYRKALFRFEIVIHLFSPNRPLAFGHHNVAGHINRFHSPPGQNIFRTTAPVLAFVRRHGGPKLFACPVRSPH